ncbi:hypothetical protein HMPREF0103_1114 [Bacteroides sp. 2_1_33B]|nr:hypothetical protein HMPREF0103_1114 [Bacteroides sp. 2_1_33B]KDS68516.1 hypothetical protein M095_1937 [Parabacteroides distasonis str. 3999B T(B) 4]KDS75301.1 hypothetical protein M096_2473 [Parabacteroides distasonis str. 3999B T(B) 6]
MSPARESQALYSFAQPRLSSGSAPFTNGNFDTKIRNIYTYT